MVNVQSARLAQQTKSQAYLRVQQQHRTFRAKANDANNVPPPATTTVDRSIRRSLVNVWHRATPPPAAGGSRRRTDPMPARISSCESFSLQATPLDPSGGGDRRSLTDSPPSSSLLIGTMAASPTGTAARAKDTRQLVYFSRSPDAEEGSVNGELFYHREYLDGTLSPPFPSPLLANVVSIATASPSRIPQQQHPPPATNKSGHSHGGKSPRVTASLGAHHAPPPQVARAVFSSTNDALRQVVPLCYAATSRVVADASTKMVGAGAEPTSARSGGGGGATNSNNNNNNNKPLTPRRATAPSQSASNEAPKSGGTPKRSTYLDPTAASSARVSTSCGTKRLISVPVTRKWFSS